MNYDSLNFPTKVVSTLFCRHCEERSNPENTAMLDSASFLAVFLLAMTMCQAAVDTTLILHLLQD